MAVLADNLEEEQIKEESLTEVRFGEHGEVTFDASDFKSIFPVAETKLSFETRAQFAAFLEQALNAKVEYAPDGVPLAADLTVKLIGEPIAVGPNGVDPIPVSDPVATMLGGLTGEMQIGDEVFCVNGERCADPVNPLALIVADSEPFPQAAPASLAIPAQSNQGLGDPPGIPMTSGGMPFSIDSSLWAGSVGLFTNAVLIRHWHFSALSPLKQSCESRPSAGVHLLSEAKTHEQECCLGHCRPSARL